MKTLNLKQDIERLIEPFLDNLCSKPYVKGVVLLGGLGVRGFMDDFSDVDIAVFTLRQDAIRFPLPFEFHYRAGGRFLEFNIHQLIIEDEEAAAKWEHSKIEAYSRSRIYYDVNGRIRRLVEAKAVFDKSEAYQRLIWIVQQYRWRGQIHALRAYQRGYPEAAHDLLNICVEMLLEAVYLLRDSYLPHRKWGLVYIKDMGAPFCDLDVLFRNALLIKGFQLGEIQRRLQVLDELFSVVMTEVRRRYPEFPDDPYVYYYRMFMQLNRRTLIDEILDKYQTELTKEEVKELHGILCFHLVETSTELKQLMSGDLDVSSHLKSKLLNWTFPHFGGQ